MANITIVSSTKDSYILLKDVKYKPGDFFCLILNKLALISRKLARKKSVESMLKEEVQKFEQKLGLNFSYTVPGRTISLQYSDPLYWIKLFYTRQLVLSTLCYLGEGYNTIRAICVKETEGDIFYVLDEIGNRVCIVPENEELKVDETYNYKGMDIYKAKLLPLQNLSKHDEKSCEWNNKYEEPCLLRYNYLYRNFTQHKKYFKKCREIINHLVAKDINILNKKESRIFYLNNIDIYKSVFRGEREYSIESIDDLVYLDLLFLLVKQRGLKRCAIVGCSKLFPVNRFHILYCPMHRVRNTKNRRLHKRVERAQKNVQPYDAITPGVYKIYHRKTRNKARYTFSRKNKKDTITIDNVLGDIDLIRIGDYNGS